MTDRPETERVDALAEALHSVVPLTYKRDAPAILAALTELGVVLVTEAELDVLDKASGIGFVSYDGDHWYAEHAGYTDPEATLEHAARILAALRGGPDATD